MKWYIAFCFSLFSLASSVAQSDSAVASGVVSNLHKALIARDKDALTSMLHRDLTYGHSNLWVESRKELLENLSGGRMTYKSIVMDSLGARRIGKTMVVRYQAAFSVNLGGKDIQLRLHVLQTWIRKKGHWRLLARQGVKMV